ncbi:DUF6193 family natural product biosynthesis protein [Kitasatospora sp. NPDC004614]|uniref:DUF6193 family natural product biosynthesis protein n=1 Tax=unclassified Kitasatospora TaxID=2633591 RepID=UPI00367B219D
MEEKEERCAAWTALAECWGPARDHGWIGTSMGDLLRLALAEPRLAEFWPWTGMNELHLSTSQDFRDFGKDSFPAVAAWQGGYRVLAAPARQGAETVLETTDPAEALACLLELMGR